MLVFILVCLTVICIQGCVALNKIFIFLLPLLFPLLFAAVSAGLVLVFEQLFFPDKANGIIEMDNVKMVVNCWHRIFRISPICGAELSRWMWTFLRMKTAIC